MVEAPVLGSAVIVGAVVFALIAVALTAVQWPALRNRGWDPIRTSDVPYPSVLALGAGGRLQILGFAILGLALFAAGAGLAMAIDPAPTVVSALLAIAGASALALMAPTDGSLSSVSTWRGAVHAAAFFILLISIVLAMLALVFALGDQAAWAGLRLASIAAAILVIALTIASFVVDAIGGLASLASIAVMLLWLAVVGGAVATLS